MRRLRRKRKDEVEERRGEGKKRKDWLEKTREKG